MDLRTQVPAAVASAMAVRFMLRDGTAAAAATAGLLPAGAGNPGTMVGVAPGVEVFPPFHVPLYFL